MKKLLILIPVFLMCTLTLFDIVIAQSLINRTTIVEMIDMQQKNNSNPVNKEVVMEKQGILEIVCPSEGECYACNDRSCWPI
jgi:hypothetical protein